MPKNGKTPINAVAKKIVAPLKAVQKPMVKKVEEKKARLKTNGKNHIYRQKQRRKM
jgi:hypothetical protein